MSLAVVARFYQVDSHPNYPDLLTRSIIQNKQGYILLGTDSGLLKFDGYKLQPLILKTQNQKKNSINSIKKLFIDSQEALWIATRGQGLYRHISDETQLFKHNTDSENTISSNYISDIVEDNKGGWWIGTENGLNYITSTYQISHFPFYNNKNEESSLFITSLLINEQGNLLVGTKTGLFLFDSQTRAFKNIVLENYSLDKKQDTIIYTLHMDNSGDIWVGSQSGAYYKQKESLIYKKFNRQLINSQVLSITSSENDIWIGTISNGLFKFSKSDKTIDNYTYHSHNKNALSDNTILSLFYDQSGVLWVSTFYKGLNYIDTNTLDFGLENDSISSIECANNLLFTGFVQDNLSNLWIANEKALIKYNKKQSQCETHILNQGRDIFSTALLDNQNQLWLATTKGLHKFDKELNRVIEINGDVKDLPIHFMVEYDANTLLLATRQGLFIYRIKEQQLSSIKTKQVELSNTRIYDYATDKNNQYYFATQIGIASLVDNKLSIYSQVQSQLAETEILSLFIDQMDNLWVGTYKYGLYKFDPSGALLFHNAQFGSTTNMSIHSIIDGDNHLWLGTDRGLIKLNIKNNEAHIFHKTDGLQEGFFNVNATYKTPDGKLYFGGRNGFNAFYPEDIKINKIAPNIVLTDFTRFGKSVDIGKKQNGFLLKKPINELEELTLGHNDYVIGFEFAALDYADPSRNKYAYMMEGLDPDWNYVNADNRRISYSNLKSGAYTFKVKGSNKDGIWNEQGKSLKIRVLPAPWLSWWAFSSYVLMFFGLLFWFTNRKNKANQKITALLRTEVAKQTKQLQVQKLQVETLLARKNELFANVSHEFRTPLTLILGPVNKLLKSHLPATDINALKMINRNANRLLTMIEQLLQLAKISDNENIRFIQLKTKPIIEAIVDSFKPLADEKKIDLQLNNNEKAAINSSTDAIEIILGNLLSNAIKYTPIGGSITVNSIVADGQVNIQVTDTGCGLDANQQKDIFNRFKRLNTHQNIAGIGIGLSVVEEVLKVNNGTIEIISQPGEGSTFIVSFNCISMDFEEADAPSDSLLLKQLTDESQETHMTLSQQQSIGRRKYKESVLIIEDNHDMRAHIAETLKNHYHCLLATGGKEGIALAIKHVPDIIICDVMMPEMDGFHVCRIMRSDSRTSHIPLVLLTALEDKASRIRGWREHVDVYLTKPFDAQELLLQLENILVIRNILKKKAGQLVKAGKTLTNSDLPKKDQQFIDKLNKLITKKFHDPLFLRPQMASDMAISERQLQRKLKALIDKNPMDLLREYRLSQAAIMLKDGYQVSITSDQCGFNSLPHFSKCFKSQFGMAPKIYQKTVNDS